MSVRLAVLLIWLALPAWAQGFAGLGADSDAGFDLPDPAYRMQFPQDHGAHPDFRIEWWYVTANLTGEDGQDYGVQWTLFRSALTPDGDVAGWTSTQVWLGHAGLTTPDAHFSAERRARGGIGQAGVSTTPFAAWIDEWRMAGEGFDQLRLTASSPEFAYDLTLRAAGPLVAQGRNGYSVKSPSGQASHYYSQPFFTVSGNLNLPGGQVAVTGQAWADREWSSQPLAADQDGWDWISLHLDGGAKLMGFRLRSTGGGSYSSGTMIGADGTAHPFGDGALEMTPLSETEVAGRQVPTRWRVDLPGHDVSVTLEAINPQSWMDTSFAYWEGPVRLSGSHGGRGYLEMTGYR